MISESTRAKRSAPVASPFADIEASTPRTHQDGSRKGLRIGVGVAVMAVSAAGLLLLASYLRDPFRTLEPFPVAKYMESHRALAGLTFKADLRVEADLGWKPEAGRLMLFSLTNEARPLAVLVPASVAKDIHYTKGQVYQAELEVKEGGLIYANACRKN